MHRRINSALALIFNLFIVSITSYCVICFFIGQGGGIVGFECFRYFTVLSNVFMAIISLLLLPLNIFSLIKDKYHIPTWLRILSFTASISIGVTFLTVMLFLGPTAGYGAMLSGINLFMHLVTPLCAIVSYLFFEDFERFKFRYSFIGVLPVIIYGIIYALCVLVFKIWPDFYGFNKGGMWPISMLVMFTLAIALSVGYYFLKKVINKKLLKAE